MTATKKKVGRPERTKQSYANEVQRLKNRLAKANLKIENLQEWDEVQNEWLMRYHNAPLVQRIKYVITKEL